MVFSRALGGTSLFELCQKNLARILDRQDPHLQNMPVEVLPYYDGLNLANIPSSICHWFGIPAPRSELLSIPHPPIHPEKIRNIILLLVDGLPYQRMYSWLEKIQPRKFSNWNRDYLEENAAFTALTSISPSTTANALTSLWTGKFPSEHGVIGYELYLQEYERILNMILQTEVYPNFDPDTAPFDLAKHAFLPVDTLGSHFKKHGITPFALQHESINGSGLSRMLLADVEKVPYASLEEMWQKTRAVLDQDQPNRKYIYLYWSEQDTLSHRFGPDSRRTRSAWHYFHHNLEKFINERISAGKQDTILLVTSDHGQIATNIQPKYDVRHDQDFMHCLQVPPSGESRFPYLFVKPDHIDRFQQIVEQRWGSQFQLLPSSTMLHAGVFGETTASPTIEHRIGNFCALPVGNAYWWWANKENHLLGRHGGFSKLEMLTPFLSLVL